MVPGIPHHGIWNATQLRPMGEFLESQPAAVTVGMLVVASQVHLAWWRSEQEETAPLPEILLCHREIKTCAGKRDGEKHRR